MSYSLNIMGYGYSKEVETEGPLTDALSKLDAKFSTFDLGSFLYELGGMKYKEVAGGFYSWMLYRVGPTGNMMPTQEGISALVPRPGERIYAVYEFHPSGRYVDPGLYELPELPGPPEEPEPAEYHFVPLEGYELPELVEYGQLVQEPEGPAVTEFTEQEKRPLPEYSFPDFTTPLFKPVETYQLVRPLPTPRRSPVPEFQDNSDLERFLMDILASARLAFLLPRPEPEEESTVPLAQV